MYKLYENYKEIVEETLLGEVRQSFDSLPTSVGLIIYNNQLILLDTSNVDANISVEELEKHILGQIEVDDVSDSLYEVDSVSAIKGYGLLLYELAMQYIYPNQLISTRDGKTKDEALRLYKYFYDGLNPKVDVETLQPNDDDYDDFYLNSKGEYFTTLYNSRFSMKPNEINELVRRGSDLLNQIKDKQSFHVKLGIVAYNFFRKKYKLEK